MHARDLMRAKVVRVTRGSFEKLQPDGVELNTTDVDAAGVELIAAGENAARVEQEAPAGKLSATNVRGQHDDGSCHIGRRRADIDGLRALGIVVAFALQLRSSRLPTEVEHVYLVISGYVCAASLLKSTSPSSGEMLIGFYARRLQRIAPAMVLVVSITSSLIAVVVHPQTVALGSYDESGIFALLGCANHYFARLGRVHEPLLAEEYNPLDIGSAQFEYQPFAQHWQLGLVLQYSLVLPGIIVALYCQRVVGDPPCILHEHAFSTIMLCVLLVAAVAAAVVLNSVLCPRLSAYLLPTRLWELLAGTLLCDLQAHCSPSAAWLATHGQLVVILTALLDVAGPVCMVLGLGYCPTWRGLASCHAALEAETSAEAVTMTGTVTGFVGDAFSPAAALTVIGTLCFLAAGCAPSTRLELPWPLSAVRSSVPLPLCNALLSHEWVGYVGRLSFSAYLCNWSLIVLFRHALQGEPLTQPLIEQLRAAALTAPCAVIIYHVVEGPTLRKWHVLRLSPVMRSLRIMLTIALVLVLGAAWLALLGGPLRSRLFLLKRTKYVRVPPPLAPPPLPPPPSSPCVNFCEALPGDWSFKCVAIGLCVGCAACVPPPAPPPVPLLSPVPLLPPAPPRVWLSPDCSDLCEHLTHPWTLKCVHTPICTGCTECDTL